MKSARNYRLILLYEHPFCFWCDCPLDETTATVEHVIPVSRGGGNKLSNFVLACRPCNNSRGNPDISREEAQKIVEQWPRRAKRLSPHRTKIRHRQNRERKHIAEQLSRVDWDAAWKTWYSKTYGEPFGEKLNIPAVAAHGE